MHVLGPVSTQFYYFIMYTIIKLMYFGSLLHIFMERFQKKNEYIQDHGNIYILKSECLNLNIINLEVFFY